MNETQNGSISKVADTLKDAPRDKKKEEPIVRTKDGKIVHLGEE